MNVLAGWLAWSLAAAPPAEADLDRWVLLVEADAAARPGVSIDGSVRSAARFRLGMRFLTPEEAFVEGGFEAESGLSSCAADADCIAARLRDLRAEYALLVVVRRVGAEDLIALRVVRTATGEVVHRSVVQAPADDAIGGAAESAAAAALDALGYAKGGELLVAAQPVNATIVAGDRPHPLVSGQPTLVPAGVYTVRASMTGFEDASAEVQVRAGESARVDLVLVRPQPSLTDNVWFWVGVGAGVAVVGAVVGAAFLGSDRCFCAGTDPGQCASCP